MPKKQMKGKQKSAGAATPEEGDDFEGMLAELRTADLTALKASSNPSATSNAFNHSSGSAAASNSAPYVSEETISSACRAGDTTSIRRWGRQGVRLVSGSPLCDVAIAGRVDVMRCMVEELRADVNKSDEKVVGCTPLFLAVCAGRVDMVRSLADLGADLNQVTEDGLMLLHWSALEGRLDMVRCLLLELGAVVNKGGQRGSTPLYCAAQNGHLEVVRFLVEYGADVDQANDNGQTPLMAASFKKNEKVFRCLIKHGANVQASTASGHRASDVSKMGGAPMAQTEYLEAKAHCSSPGCSGAGLKKCTGCKQVRYCGQACQLAHWKAHKSDCQTNKELRRKPRDE